MNADFIAKRHDVALKMMKALYDPIAWWKKNAGEGNAIIAKGMDMKLPDVELVLGKDGTGLDGGLYVYDFMETARFCGVAPGEPPFQQTNGQMKDHFALLNTWWKRFGLIKSEVPTTRASTAACSGSSTRVDIAVDLDRRKVGRAPPRTAPEPPAPDGPAEPLRQQSWSCGTFPRPTR